MTKTIEELGWLIERHIGANAYWWCGWHKRDVFYWDTNSLKAVRFARKEDAEAVNTGLMDGQFTVTEHAWLSKEENDAHE